ncbi:MAG TPA: threonine synthase [Nitriliruptoraceae bacterium]|nr:threonine synthase [Nitriliruptoraceae bacterium]
MRYSSTRGHDAEDFIGAMMMGLAEDGGLFVPDEWPWFDADDLRAMASLTYPEIAFRVMRPFIDAPGEGTEGRGIADDDLATVLDEAYAGFQHQGVAPLSQLGPNEWLMELWHGPTLAFKDVAMQVLGRLYDLVLAQTGDRITLVGATSGDTGSAAIEAVRHSERATIFVMHPHGRTTEVQRRQMTTVLDDNVHNIAVEGTFDDTQRILKALFNDAEFRNEVSLSGVNSINWARVLPQIVYYVTAAVALGAPDREVAFSVPTGNFGDIYAGYAAQQMGVPISRLVIATNSNDILARFLATGRHELGAVTPTMSPSMDIQVSSNFERLLFDIHGRDGDLVAADMAALESDGAFEVDAARLGAVRELFGAHRADEAATAAAITAVHDETGRLIDPHTAVGVHAARVDRDDHPSRDPMVVLGPAHPAKFPAAVAAATGVHPPLPDHMADLLEREERMVVLPAEVGAVAAHVRATLESS